MKKNITPPEETVEKAKETEEELVMPGTKRADVAHESLSEDSISTEAIDFEDSSFVEENKHKGKKAVSVADNDDDDTDEYERKFIEAEIDRISKDEDISEEAAMDKVIREIAEQPFEVAMNNLEVTKAQVIHAATGVFSSKGYFEMDFSLPFGGSVTMRSKSVNDYVDYNEYVRRLLLDPISQKEFDTFTQLRNMTYAIVSMDGDDYSEMDIEDKFTMLKGTSEIKITAIVNEAKPFWRVTHLLLHPGLVDFLAETPEE